MEQHARDTSIRTGPEVPIIRRQVRDEDIQMRGRGMSSSRLKGIRRGLFTLYFRETTAAAIYQFQITKKPIEHNRLLIGAMCTEMTHLQDFQALLFQYGFRPSILRWAYWLVGFTIGFFSRLRGTKAILKIGIWVETKAVNHYEELLETVDWEEDVRQIVKNNQGDESHHIKQWQNLLQQEEAEGKT